MRVRKVNIHLRRLYQETSKEFVEFVMTNCRWNQEYNKGKVFQNYDDKAESKLTSNLFTRYLRRYAQLNAARYIDRQSNGQYFFQIQRNTELSPIESEKS